MSQSNHIRRGFSLIELVIVVVIIGIIAAIAIPRLSRGAKGAGESALQANLSVLRSAIDLYAAEHSNAYPDKDSTKFVNQLTKFSDAAGDVTANGTKDTTHVYGPYLRKMPTLPVGTTAAKGSTDIFDGSGGAAPTGTGGGWWYNSTTGEIKANLTDTDVDYTTNKAYNTY